MCISVEQLLDFTKNLRGYTFSRKVKVIIYTNFARA